MKAFVTGATGYIGLNVAKALRRDGFQVWGLTRSEQKADFLAQNEIHPVIGDMQDPDSYLDVATECSVLAHAAADYKHDTPALDKKTVKNLIKSGKKGAQTKTLLYTSGCWIIGNTGNKMADETTPANPVDAVQWRPEIEELVIESDDLNGIVIRPGCVYGERGGLTGMWFNGAENEHNLTAVGDGTNYWTMVHVDDLADAYVRAARSGLAGEVFNISDRSRWTVGEMVNAVAGATNYQGDIQFIPVDEAAGEMGPIAEALALNQHVDGSKAANLLGWQPKHMGFVDEVETFYKSWKAWQS